MSAPAPARRRASLGSAAGDEVFANLDLRIFRRFLGFLKPHRAALAGAQAAVLLAAASQVVLPSVIGLVVSAAVEGNGHALDERLAIFVGVALLYALAAFLEPWLASRLAQRVIFDIRRKMFDHFQDVSLSFMDKTHVGRIMSRLQGDVNTLQDLLESSNGALGDLAMLIGITGVLLALDLKLALLTLLVLPALILARAVWLPYSKASFLAAREASSAANAALAENINGVRTVQETRREALNLELYAEKAAENFKAQVAAAWMAQIMTPAVDVLTGLAMAVVVVVGGEAVLGGRLKVGVMVAFIFYLQRFFDPVRLLSTQYTVMQQASAAARRIFEILDVPIHIRDAPGAVDLKGAPATVEFRHVTFGYDPARPILHDINLTARAGEVLALVGPTGSGKTSLISLARRLYDTTEGQVLVGGRDVREVTLASLSSTISMVLQEPFLFTGTIEENIRYNAASASLDDVIEAAKAVSAHEVIMRLPEGYQTVLGQRGRNLSVGGRQLISFARALIANPQILILDEATASIDSFTEAAIQRALKVLFKGRTSIVIAHRLATVRDADQIAVLQHGRIIERGAHEALMRAKGLYARLYTSSHASFDDAADVISGRARADGPADTRASA